MFCNRLFDRIRAAAYPLLTMFVVTTAIIFGGVYSRTAAAKGDSGKSRPTAPSVVFNANPGSLGSIPDGGAACGNTPGPPKNVTFDVSGLTGATSNLAVSVTFGSPNHTFMGDIVATLIAPNGVPHVLFGRTGAISAGSNGDGTNLGGTYVFSDIAPAQPSGGWWQESSVRLVDEVMSSGTYRTTALGGDGQTNPAPPTSMNTAFAGVANPNGTWTLRLTDGCAVDTGAVTAASLNITTGSVIPQHVGDYNGDAKTDFTVARDINGSIVWFNYDGVSNPPAGITYNYFGLTQFDFITPEDFDGDNKTDIAVWRGGIGGVASYYILQSSDNTVRAEPFGQDNDDPALVGDYDGDGKADPAVYRCPSIVDPAAQCFFYYRGSLNNPSGIFKVVPWGFGNDGDFFPYLGDFDGDGKNDFCIQRSDPTDTAKGQFVLLRSSDQGVEYIPWGFSSDFLIPGDYDGDGKTDFCVRRSNFPSAGVRSYFTLTRTGGGFYQQWGSNGDVSVPGDYDGDGKTDFAVWRGSAQPGQSIFYVLESGTGNVRAFPWGACPVGSCDFPVASWSVH